VIQVRGGPFELVPLSASGWADQAKAESASTITGISNGTGGVRPQLTLKALRFRAPGGMILSRPPPLLLSCLSKTSG